MKKRFKKMSLTFIIIIIIITLNNIVFAFDSGSASDFIEMGKNQSALNQEHLNEIGKEFSDIGNILVFIGAGILVAATGYMGILYMISSPDKQAKLKQQLVGLLVSAAVIFGAHSIWSMIISIMESAF